MTATTIDDLNIGDIVRTRTGRCDRIVTRLRPADSPEKLAQHGGAGQKVDAVNTRALRDGKPFGPETSATPDRLTIVQKVNVRKVGDSVTFRQCDSRYVTHGTIIEIDEIPAASVYSPARLRYTIKDTKQGWIHKLYAKDLI